MLDVLDAVRVLIDVWTLEQHHEQLSLYRYFELLNGGKGSPTEYTGMTWSGFRPSDDHVSYTNLRAHETPEHLVCRLPLEK